MTAEVHYLGELRTKCVHLASGNGITTDAPIDNHGKGEYFSPTDLVCTALAACMLTTMGIKANHIQVDITDAKASVLKVMYAEPRRIGEIHVAIMLKNNIDEKTKTILENTAHTCPVAKSLAPETKIITTFQYV